MTVAILRPRVAPVAISVGLIAITGLVTSTPTFAATPRASIAGTLPAWAVTSGDTPAPAVTTGRIAAQIYLAGVDPSGLAAYAMAVSSPSNSLYGHYLTPAEIQTRYGPTTAQIASIEAWVRSSGLTVADVNDHMGGYVTVTGSLAAAKRAFDVTFGSFKAPDGNSYRSPEQAASAPSSIASSILTVAGLDTAPHVAKPMLPPPGPNYWIASPCSKYYGQKTATNEPPAYGAEQSWNVCGYTQPQIRAAYGVTASGMTGAGQTVAVVDAYASPTMPGDANKFAKVTGDKPFQPGQYEQILPPSFNTSATVKRECGGAPGWYGEESLDIEAVHGQAPDADVRYVAAASCDDADLANALAVIVNNHLASIVTDSWGDLANEATITSVYDLIFQAGAAEGIGFFFSSGDNGYESPIEDPASNMNQVDYPTSSPWVTSVGGTSLAIGAQNNYEFETSWGTVLDPLSTDGSSWQSTPPGNFKSGYDGSSGGGTSTVYPQPTYQQGVVPPSLSERLPDGATAPSAMRVVPDVSALADPSTGMLVGQTTLQPNGTTYKFSLSRIGGTSVSSPTFAGIEADAQQAAGHTLGFANPAIYHRYGTSAFHDVTDHPLGPGSLAQVRNNYTNPSTKQGPLLTYLRTLGVDGEGASALNATTGYDDATGVGSPDQYVQSFKS
jgi:subtilase family serine protease